MGAVGQICPIEAMQNCPVCGLAGWPVKKRRGSRTYIYFRHRDGGECYVGPQGPYVYVEERHQLGLTAVTEQDYVWTAVQAVRKAVAARSRRTAEEALVEVLAAVVEGVEEVPTRFRRRLVELLRSTISYKKGGADGGT